MAADYKFIEIASDAEMTSLRLNRPTKRNAFHAEMIREIVAAIDTVNKNTSAKVLTIEGAGPFFCAGGDIAWMLSIGQSDRQCRLVAAHQIDDLFNAIADSRAVTVAAVHGGAVGGGVGIVSACDLVVAAESSFFATTEAKLGIVPACVTNHLLNRTGMAFTRRMLLTSQRIGATEAARAGLVDVVCEDGCLHETARKLASDIATGGSLAHQSIKQLLRRFHPRTVAAEPRHTEVLADSWASAEGVAGMKRFVE